MARNQATRPKRNTSSGWSSSDGRPRKTWGEAKASRACERRKSTRSQWRVPKSNRFRDGRCCYMEIYSASWPAFSCKTGRFWSSDWCWLSSITSTARCTSFSLAKTRSRWVCSSTGSASWLAAERTSTRSTKTMSRRPGSRTSSRPCTATTFRRLGRFSWPAESRPSLLVFSRLPLGLSWPVAKFGRTGAQAPGRSAGRVQRRLSEDWGDPVGRLRPSLPLVFSPFLSHFVNVHSFDRTVALCTFVVFSINSTSLVNNTFISWDTIVNSFFRLRMHVEMVMPGLENPRAVTLGHIQVWVWVRVGFISKGELDGNVPRNED